MVIVCAAVGIQHIEVSLLSRDAYSWKTEFQVIQVESFTILTHCTLSTGNGGQGNQPRKIRGGQTEGQISQPWSQARGI